MEDKKGMTGEEMESLIIEIRDTMLIKRLFDKDHKYDHMTIKNLREQVMNNLNQIIDYTSDENISIEEYTNKIIEILES